MNIEFVAADTAPTADMVVSLAAFEGRLGGAATALDQRLDGLLAKAVAGSRFTGAVGQTLDIVAPHGFDAARLIIVGMGAREKMDTLGIETAAAHAYQAAKATGAKTLMILLPNEPASLPARAAFGVKLAAYRFDKYRTKEKPEAKPSITTVQLAVDDPQAARAAFETDSGLADAIIFARDLVTEPANILYPEEFARRVKELERLGLEVEILGEPEMTRLGMGSLLGVGQGSRRESQLAVIQWKGAADPAAQPIAFVGKGVCFDTGGISIKPAGGMEDMISGTWPGPRTVIGLMYCAGRAQGEGRCQSGMVGLVENMPSGNGAAAGRRRDKHTRARRSR